MIRLRRAENKEFYILITGVNGEELYKSSETYKRRAGAEKSVAALAKVFGNNASQKIIDETKRA